MLEKICTKCKIKKKLSEFYKNKRSKDGYATQCISCDKAYKKINKVRIQKVSREYRTVNKSRICENYKLYSKKNKKSLQNKHKIYREANKERIKDYMVNYREENKEILVKKQKIQRRAYYIKNKLLVEKKRKIYVKNNPEKVFTTQQNYRHKHKNKISDYKKTYSLTERGKMVKLNSHHKRRELKLIASDGTLPIQPQNNMQTKNLKEMLEAQNYKCNFCKCEIHHGLGNIHLDHIIPLSKGGKHSVDNVQWLCATCNMKKGNRINMI